jgi:hypothetical protein
MSCSSRRRQYGCCSQSREQTAPLLRECVIQCAVERFIHKAVAIGLGKATIVAVRNHIKPFGIGVITRKRDACCRPVFAEYCRHNSDSRATLRLRSAWYRPSREW